MKNSDSWYLSVTLKNDFRTLPLSSAQVHISEKRKPSCNKQEIASICLNNLTLGIDMKIYTCMMPSSYIGIISLSFMNIHYQIRIQSINIKDSFRFRTKYI